MRTYSILLSIFLVLVSSKSFSQNEGVSIGIVGDKFTDFTLGTYQGDQISTSKLRGKNILLISSRGKSSDKYWCGICSYQYAEFSKKITLTQ